ncbi:MAG: efflux transporter outer membrane subunit [Planctomycetota bacterium]|nr:efflux transporter outer membrane subunit [Planctomycetota bacterium]
MMPTRLSLLLCCTVAVLAGCKVGPDYVSPDLHEPDKWYAELTDGLSEGKADLSRWWTLLEDETLNELIEQAAGNNLNLELAYQRVIEAQALRGVAASNRWPDIDGVGSAQIRETSDRIDPLSVNGGSSNVYSIGASAVWELDVWGRVSRLIEAADADLAAVREGYRDVLVVLLAQVGLEYIELRTLQERIRLADVNVKLQEGTLKLTQDRKDAGLVSELDVRQAEQNLARTKSQVPILRLFLGQTENRIAVLLGANPGSLDEKLSKAGSIPKLPKTDTVIGPLEALRRRPDVRQAERILAAQTARIGVAEAELYPQFSLSGSFGFDGLNGSLSDTFNSDAISSSFGPQFRWNLFDGGAVEGNIAAQKARTAQALDGYRQTVLLALEEVENSIIAYAQQSRRRALLGESVTAAQRAVELVDTLYKDGLTDFQNVLDSQRSLSQEQDALAVTEGAVVQALVQLYKALGGGWNPEAHSSASEGSSSTGGGASAAEKAGKPDDNTDTEKADK